MCQMAIRLSWLKGIDFESTPQNPLQHGGVARQIGADSLTGKFLLPLEYLGIVSYKEGGTYFVPLVLSTTLSRTPS